MKIKARSVVALLAILTLIVTLVPLANSESAMAAPDSDRWEAVPLPASLPLGATLDDVMPSPDGGTLFLSTTDSGSNTSTLWRSSVPASSYSWEQVMASYGGERGNSAGATIIRINSLGYADDPIIYWCDLGGTGIMMSADGGETFAPRTAPAPITDVAVEDRHTLYLASAGDVYKSVNGGAVWSPAVDAGIGTLYMIATTLVGDIFVGGTNGGVSRSIDGGATFTPLPPLPVGGNVQVVSDTYYADNNIIYAGGERGNVYRSSDPWGLINAAIADVSGLAMHGRYLYAANATPAGGVVRIIVSFGSPVLGHGGLSDPRYVGDVVQWMWYVTLPDEIRLLLEPHIPEPLPPFVDIITGLPDGATFNVEPSALRCFDVPGTNYVALFAIDTTHNDLYEYIDTAEGLVFTPWDFLVGAFVTLVLISAAPLVLIGAALGAWLW